MYCTIDDVYCIMYNLNIYRKISNVYANYVSYD